MGMDPVEMRHWEEFVNRLREIGLTPLTAAQTVLAAMVEALNEEANNPQEVAAMQRAVAALMDLCDQLEMEDDDPGEEEEE